MGTRTSVVIAIGIVLVSFAIGMYFYPRMPEQVASHWNARGEVDGYMSKFWGLFLMPLLATVFLLFFIWIPRIDPLKANIQLFRKYYNGFIAIILLFLFYLYLLTVLWNRGTRFNMVVAILPAFAILFYYCGIVIQNAKRNWFIGIRTPWTMSSDNVWEKTHKLGGKLFKIVAILALLGILLQRYAFFLVLLPVLLVALYTIVYSYVEFQKERG